MSSELKQEATMSSESPEQKPKDKSNLRGVLLCLIKTYADTPAGALKPLALSFHGTYKFLKDHVDQLHKEFEESIEDWEPNDDLVSHFILPGEFAKCHFVITATLGNPTGETVTEKWYDPPVVLRFNGWEWNIKDSPEDQYDRKNTGYSFLDINPNDYDEDGTPKDSADYKRPILYNRRESMLMGLIPEHEGIDHFF